MMQSNEGATDTMRCGARLKQARIDAGLSHEDVAARLKMPVRVVRALESDDWSVLGAPVFVRGQLHSYARLLKIDIDPVLAESGVEPVRPPELVSHSHRPRYQRMFEQTTRRAAYIAITVAIAVPVWLATRPHLANNVAVQSLDLPGLAVTDTPGSRPDENRPSEPVERVAPEPEQRTPLVASMASIPRAEPGLSMSFDGDSWVQVFAADGDALEQGMFAAGDRLSFDEGELGRVVLGNASVVEVRQAGERIDLESFSRANVARFTLSSDGSLAPVDD